MPDPSIALLGHGRFGAALGGLLQAQGRAWRAWDPQAEVPEPHRAHDLASLLGEGGLVIVAVPVPVLGEVLATVRPLLDGRHTVIDVGSVKEGPCALMDQLLGDAVPHVGTHPLFGPLSIARAEPLRTVVCPSARHPEAARVARALFESLGSEVVEQTPSAHDRFMAVTHAMAFFIAKGLVDLGLGDDLRWAPPSFAALAASIAAVRADAGHLFRAIQHQNPYAAEARTRFIEALGLIDARLAAEPGEAAPGAGDALRIPDLGQQSPALREVRDHIDELDRELIGLLRRRRELSLRAAEAKRQLGAPVLDASREVELMRRRADWAGEQGLDPELAQAVFREILAMSRRAQG